MNELSEEKRHTLKIIVILVVLAFFIIYGLVMFFKYSKPNEEKQLQNSPQIIFKQPLLQFFSYKTQLNTYPDRITIHYPYLIVVRPDQFQSEIYNIATKRKERELNELVLDYFNGEMVYNKQGYTTFFNNKNLGLLCDRAFIKSNNEILCITRPDQNSQANKLIVINPQTLAKKDIYTSQNVLTAVYYDKTTLYIGEYNFDKNIAYITVNNKTTKTNDLVNLIYPMGNKMNTASLKSKRNNMNESYSEVLIDNNIQTKLIKHGEIVISQDTN